MRSICLDSELHMLFLVTPCEDIAINPDKIDWNLFHKRWSNLGEKLKRVAARVGVNERYLVQKIGGGGVSNDSLLQVHVRFLTTLMLYELINEKTLDDVARQFGVPRGQVQTLQQQAATYAYMVVSFCDRLGWCYLKTLLEGFTERLQFGIRRDLTDLVQVAGIDAIRARALHQNGISSIASLAGAPVERIRNVLRKAVPFLSSPTSTRGNYNTWLFGEAALDDVEAARILVERAKIIFKERINEMMTSYGMSIDFPLMATENASQRVVKLKDEIGMEELNANFLNITMSPDKRPSPMTIRNPNCSGLKFSSNDSTPLDSGYQSVLAESNPYSNPKTDVHPTVIDYDPEERENAVCSLDRSLFDASGDLFETSHRRSEIEQEDLSIKTLKKTRLHHILKESIQSMSPQSPPYKRRKDKKLEDADEVIHICSCTDLITSSFQEVGLDLLVHDDKHLSIILACPNDTFYQLPLFDDLRNCPKCTKRNNEEFLARILSNSDIQKVFFDLLLILRQLRHLIRTHSATPSEVFCIRTMLLSCDSILDDVRDKQIEDLADKFVWPPWLKGYHTFDGVKKSAVRAYFTLNLKKKLVLISSPKLMSLYNESVRVLAEMEIRGMAIDHTLGRNMVEKILSAMSEFEEEIYRLSGVPFNLNSSADTARILFSKMKLNVPKNASGVARHFSTRSEVLEQIPHPICEKIIQWRKLEHALKYLRGLIASIDIDSCRIHTEFDHISATAGRILASNPSLQMAPKQVLICDYSVRSVFIAPEGRVLIAADYCQLELRILCQLSNDENLLSLLNDETHSKGMFERIAEHFNSVSKFMIDRSKAKQLCYGIIYGMGHGTLGQELGLDTSTAEELISNYLLQFPKVKEWITQSIEDCRKSGTVHTFMGKARNFESTICADLAKDRSQAERQTINYIIQGTASEIFKKALIEVNQKIKEFDSYIVMQLHDELICEASANMVDRVLNSIKSSMEGVCPEFRVKLPVKLSIGKNWGSMKPVVL